VFKLECLKIKHRANYFALWAKLFIKTNRMAYERIAEIKGCVTSVNNLLTNPSVSLR